MNNHVPHEQQQAGNRPMETWYEAFCRQAGLVHDIGEELMLGYLVHGLPKDATVFDLMNELTLIFDNLCVFEEMQQDAEAWHNPYLADLANTMHQHMSERYYEVINELWELYVELGAMES